MSGVQGISMNSHVFTWISEDFLLDLKISEDSHKTSRDFQRILRNFLKIFGEFLYILLALRVMNELIMN